MNPKVNHGAFGTGCVSVDSLDVANISLWQGMLVIMWSMGT